MLNKVALSIQVNMKADLREIYGAPTRVAAAQDGLQVLVGDEPRPDKTREAEHHGEQPDDAGDTGLVGERELETGEIDLGLLARRRLEAHLEWLDRLRPDAADGPLHGRVTAAIASLTQLAPHRTAVRPG